MDDDAQPGLEPDEGPSEVVPDVRAPVEQPPEGAALNAAPDNAPPVTARADEAAPTLPLPGQARERAAAGERDRRVTALWSADQEGNTWVGIGGVGWRRLGGGCDSAHIALTMLAAHAREQGSRVHYRESDGVIGEIYVW